MMGYMHLSHIFVNITLKEKVDKSIPNHFFLNRDNSQIKITKGFYEHPLKKKKILSKMPIQ